MNTVNRPNGTHPPEVTPTEARQGIMLGRMRYVLIISTIAAITALLAVYLAA